MTPLWRARRSETGVCWNSSARRSSSCCLDHIDRLTLTAAQMLAAEQELG